MDVAFTQLDRLLQESRAHIRREMDLDKLTTTTETTFAVAHRKNTPSEAMRNIIQVRIAGPRYRSHSLMSDMVFRTLTRA